MSRLLGCREVDFIGKDGDRNRDGDGDSESSDSDKGNASCEQKQGKELMQGKMADNKLSLSPPLSPSASFQTFCSFSGR
jgi:hypothetical protein